MTRNVPLIDPEQLARITNLQLLARTVVEGMSLGLHRSPHTGSSVEFAQYRPYTQGDDLRFVDWRLYGRTDRLYIKQFEKETNLRCTIVLDCSASMKYGHAGITKFHYAKMLAACLAYLLDRQADAAGFVAYRDDVDSFLPARRGAKHLRRILVELDALEPAGTTNTEGTLRFIGSTLRPRGMVVLISDLLHPIDATILDLRSLCAQRHNVVVLQICDPAERDFSFKNSLTLVDAENAREQFVVPDAVREQYLHNRAKHFNRIRAECLREEIEIEEFATDKPLDHALHYFLRRRAHALVRSSRIRRSAVGGVR
jgi:uncharacterized protein (DUF58 family)